MMYCHNCGTPHECAEEQRFIHCKTCKVKMLMVKRFVKFDRKSTVKAFRKCMRVQL